jgi:hypothetical protein
MGGLRRRPAKTRFVPIRVFAHRKLPGSHAGTGVALGCGLAEKMS